MNKKLLISVLLVALLAFGCFTVTASAATKLAAPDVSASNVAATGKNKLTWDKVSNAVQYKVYRSTTKNGTYRLLNTVKSTTFINTSAESGKSYYYYVVAVDKNGNTSAKSNIVLRKCDLPRPVTTLSSVASSGKVKVTWKAIPGAQKYEVYRATSKSGTYSKMYTTTATSYVNTSATVGKTYYYKVKALASVSSADSAFSTIGYRTCDCPRPDVKIGNVASSGKVKLTWDAVTGAKKYEVYRATSKNGTYTKMYTTSSTSYVNSSAVAGKVYYYKVKAKASFEAADSAFSLVEYQTCDLARPQITVTLNSNAKPKISWSAVSGAKGYEVYRSTKESSGYTLLKTVTGTSFTNTGAASDTKYYYKVKAIAENSLANSAYSTVKSITSGLAGETLSTRYVYQPSVNIYDEPSNDADKMSIAYMKEVKLGSFVREGVDYGWRRLCYNGKWYYVYISEDTQKFTSTKSTYKYTGNTEYQQALIDEAIYIYKNWDTYYTHGASDGVADKDGEYGFDCSGFATYLLDETMRADVPVYDLSTTIETLYNTTTIYNKDLRGEFSAKTVSLANIQPGDVIFFALNGGSVDHCGVYMGNNEFIQSTEVWDGVCIAPLRGMYKDSIVKIKRYMPASESDVLWAKETMEMNVGWSGLRAKPDWDASVQTKLAENEAVTVRFVSNTSDWSYVVTKSGKKGFVATKYLD